MPLSMGLNGNTETSENQENIGISRKTQDGIDAPDGIFRPGVSIHLLLSQKSEVRPYATYRHLF